MVNYYIKVGHYRSELMGLAILEVVLYHIFSLGNISKPLLIHAFTSLLFTRGFLFLSGYSMFHSISKSVGIWSFYQKRFFSLMVPYMIMTIPFSLFVYLEDAHSLVPFYSGGIFRPGGWLSFLGGVTSFGYWIEGNFSGMWYVSLTVVLYITVPLLYILGKRFSSQVLLIGFTIISLVIKIMIQYFFNSYYKVISVSLEDVSFFFIGFYFAKIIVMKEEISYHIFLLLLLCLFMIKPVNIVTILAIPSICLLFNQLFKYSIGWYIRNILNVLGKYSLEIYVLHLIVFSFMIVFEKLFFILNNYAVNISLTLLITLFLSKPIFIITNRIKSYYGIC